MTAKKTPAKKAARKRSAGGRPSEFSQKVADEICERLADGESLKGICQSDGMPHRATVFRWLAAHDEFRDMYARAREDQADTLADEIVAISDKDCDIAEDSAVMTARDRLRVDARKWVAAKLKPKKYGDRTTLAGDPDSPLQPPQVTVKLVRPE